MDAEPLSYTFNWRFNDHARVTRLLVLDQFESGIWRVAKWVVFAVILIAGLVTIAAAAAGDWTSTALIVTGSSLIDKTHELSQGAGHSRPVNSGKLLVACSLSIAAFQRSR